MQTADRPTTRSLLPLCISLGTCLLLASVALPFGACGRDYHAKVRGTVQAEDVCTASVSLDNGCPVCSSPDETGACRDHWYGSAVRCEADKGCGGASCNGGYCVFHDLDLDGIDDDFEREVAERNLPAIHLHPDEGCAGPRGIVYRVRRHPDAPRRLAVAYVLLYDRDCGAANGHVGDNEGLAITVDLDGRPGAAATVGVMTDAHRHTACQSIATCETATGSSACAPRGTGRIRVYASRDKHANYLDGEACALNCFDQCEAGPVDETVPLLDVGQPEAPMVVDLSDAMVTAAAGWNTANLHYDPWSNGVFGNAGHVRDQLLKMIAPAGM